MKDEEIDYKEANRRARKLSLWIFIGLLGLVSIFVMVSLLTGNPVGKAHLGSVVSDFQKNGWMFLGR